MALCNVCLWFVCVSGLVRTVPPFSRPLLFSLAKEILVRKNKAEDESIHSFVSRRLGKEVSAAEYTDVSDVSVFVCAQCYN